MNYQIDQSGKIEQTNKDTVLCLSNEEWDAVLIKARSKRQIQEVFRRNGQIRNYVLFTFCAGVALLIKRNRIKFVTIDKEYSGKEPVMKNILQSMLGKRSSLTTLTISFDHIGKGSKAHLLGLMVTRKKKKPAKILKEAELLKIIKMTEVGKRLKDA